ncbi:MAG: tetratricopeptide repeat protein [Chloroflexaceae bacterium]
MANWYQGIARHILARTAFHAGNLPEAGQLLGHSLTILQDTGDQNYRMLVLADLGDTLTAQGRYAEARDQFQAALPVALDLQQPFQMLLLLAVIANWVLQTGHRDHGIELLIVVRQHPAGGYELRRRADQTLARFRAVVEPDVYAEAEERGHALDLDAAILLAQQVLTLGERTPDHPHAAPMLAPAALPERAALTGRGQLRNVGTLMPCNIYSR